MKKLRLYLRWIGGFFAEDGLLPGGGGSGGFLRQRLAEVEVLLQARIEDEGAGTFAVVDGNDGLAGDGICVEDTPLRVDDTGTGEVGGKRGAVVELVVAVEVLTDHDIERRAGLIDDEGIE